MDQSDQRGHRPLAFEKMEGLVQEMQDPDTGVPVRSQKQFLTSIPSAFTGYDVIEWLMDRLNVEDPVEAVNIANQLCHYGYFFPVSDSKNLVVKDDGSLYRFQIPYYWPCQNRSPDNVEYAIYLAKRSLRNKQRHGLEDYELESLNSLKKNLSNKWEFIKVQAEEQVKVAKDRKKGEKTVSDSQERAYWRVHRPPPGYSSSLEPLPLRAGGSAATKKRKSSQDVKKELEFLRSCVDRTRTKVSVALESLIQFSDTYAEYDSMLTAPHPSNPWVTEDVTFWQLNSSLVEVPTEKRVKRWALSMEELVSDPTGLQEFTNYLRKEYSHENIRFWMAANDLRRSSQSQIPRKVKQIYDEFLVSGAPCEVNIDGKTMEKTQMELKNPSRFTFDSAAEHVYALLLKKDCYPRFIRSEHYKNLLASGVQPTGKKKFDFFGFGGTQAKTKNPPGMRILSSTLQTQPSHPLSSGTCTSISKRRGSDRSLSGSTHELAVPNKVMHSHSQSSITDIANRESNENVEKPGDEVCPWVFPEPPERYRLQPSPSIAEDPMATEHPLMSASRKNSTFLDSSSSSEVSMSVVAEVTERLKKSCGLHETISRFSRRSSSAANSKQIDSTRPSVSSMEDLTATPFRSFDSNLSSTSDKDSGGVPEEAALPTISHSRRRSITALIGRKPSTSNTTPLISVSSVSEQHEDKPLPELSTDGNLPSKGSSMKEMKKSTKTIATGLKKSESVEVKGEKSNFVTPVSTSRDSKTDKEKVKPDAAAASTPNEVCPWEDEENCQVKASNYMKFYETLGYL